MDKLADRKYSPSSEPDRRIDEMYQQYRQVWYACNRPFILGPIVTAIIVPLMLCLIAIAHYVYGVADKDFYVVGFAAAFYMLWLPTLLLMWNSSWTMKAQSEVMRDIMSKPGYMDLLPEMDKLHPKAAKLIRRMTKNIQPHGYKLTPS